MDTKNPHLLALTETFVIALVSISGLVACSLLSVPHWPRSHLGNLKESCWSSIPKIPDYPDLWEHLPYILSNNIKHMYNPTPSQTLKPLDCNTSYSLESHPGPGKRSFPSRKANIHLHQEAWRQGWKMDWCKSSTLRGSQNASTSACWKDYGKKTGKSNPSFSQAAIGICQLGMECKSVWCPAPPNGVQQDKLCIQPVAVRPKKPAFHRKSENPSEMPRMLNCVCVFFLLCVYHIYHAEYRCILEYMSYLQTLCQYKCANQNMTF